MNIEFIFAIFSETIKIHSTIGYDRNHFRRSINIDFHVPLKLFYYIWILPGNLGRIIIQARINILEIVKRI